MTTDRSFRIQRIYKDLFTLAPWLIPHRTTFDSRDALSRNLRKSYPFGTRGMVVATVTYSSNAAVSSSGPACSSQPPTQKWPATGVILAVEVFPDQVVAFPEAHGRHLVSPARELAVDCLCGGVGGEQGAFLPTGQRRHLIAAEMERAVAPAQHRRRVGIGRDVRAHGGESCLRTAEGGLRATLALHGAELA